MPRSPEREQDRARDNVTWCEQEFRKAVPRTRAGLLTGAFDDHRPGGTQRTVVCAVGFADLRQTSAAIVPAARD